MLSVHSIFSSIQGEGRFAGYPTAFLRLAGCNLSCAWCDAHEAARSVGAFPLSVAEAFARLTASGLRDTCITGGEPLLQGTAVAELLDRLLPLRRVVIETNGSLPIVSLKRRFPSVSFSVDWKMPSAGEPSFQEEILADLGPEDWIKFVVADRRDLDHVATALPAVASKGIESFVSPVFERGSAWFAEVGAFVTTLPARHPVRFQLQLHKMLGIP
ncbi:MAG TPA: 4Fe-4S cluster-binding domain-containing protein [bacterium]|nr:4Fe-4S cluster-binding domain-containing protein [bacterium]